MTIDASLISPVVTALCAFLGSWLAFSTRLTRVEGKVDSLADDVRRHNGVIERTYKLEKRAAVLENELHNIESSIER